MMSCVILLLPKPDVLQVANCHKYVSRKLRSYSEIYTLSTIAGNCDKNTVKILVIGHGDVGKLVNTTPAEVARAIFDSGMPLSGGGKVALDTCYAGSKGANNEQNSALHLLRIALKKLDFDCNLILVGAVSPTVTIGGLTDKRLVVPEVNLKEASNLQSTMMKKHDVKPNALFPNWKETATSGQIKIWAKMAHKYLSSFANEFRQLLVSDGYRDESDTRKVHLQV